MIWYRMFDWWIHDINTKILCLCYSCKMNPVTSTVAYHLPWFGFCFCAFACLLYPVSCVLHWNFLHDKLIPGGLIRMESDVVTATDCQNLCAAAADSEGCRSVNFDPSDRRCELLSTSVVETFPVRLPGYDVYDSCPMMTHLGRFQVWEWRSDFIPQFYWVWLLIHAGV